MTTTRRNFISSVGLLASASILPLQAFDFGIRNEKLRIVLVGTGVRGTSFWGKRLVDNYAEILEFVGLCDINPGRLEYAQKYMGAGCPLYLDFDEMIRETRPDLILVVTKDSTHHEFIVKGLDYGVDVLTEKPLTTDEKKCQEIIDAERRSGKKLIIGFNYRWSPYNTRIKEVLEKGSIGKLVSVDFHWYLNTYHGASYFRRWHGQKESGGTLLVHKATHHFDLLNWWIDSDPFEVFAYGDREFYGENGPFRGENCRTCQNKKKCAFYWDIRKDDRMMDLYVKNEHHDAYIRDNCLYRKEINIYDKMSAQIKYRNNVVVNYSLTTYSPYEGWKVSFNGTEGKLDAWLDIPFIDDLDVDQAELHAKEMDQGGEAETVSNPIILHKLWKEYEKIEVVSERKGHGGGDKRLHEKIFVNPGMEDPYGRAAGLRDGVMSVLIGIAARNSIESGEKVRIGALTSIEPRVKRL